MIYYVPEADECFEDGTLLDEIKAAGFPAFLLDDESETSYNSTALPGMTAASCRRSDKNSGFIGVL